MAIARATRTVLLFLALGAGATVAVAWTCALAVSPYAARPVVALAAVPGEVWEVTRLGDVGTAWVASRRLRGYAGEGKRLGPDPARVVPLGLGLRRPASGYASGAVPYEIRMAEVSGWPLAAFWYEPLEDYRERLGLRSVNGATYPLRGGIVTGLRPWRPAGVATVPRVLPVRPLWLGASANTAIYAAGLWLIVRGPFVMRSRWRRRSGRCPACGYDLRGAGTAVCPECGSDRA